MCGPRQLFFFQCGPETPKCWTPLRASLEHAHAPSGHELRISSWTPRAPMRLATRGAVSSGSSSPAYPRTCLHGPLFLLRLSELTAAPLWLTSFLQHFQSTAWGLCSHFSYPEPFLCLTVPSFNEHTLKITWTHVVNSFLHKVKNLCATGQPGADLRLDDCPVTPG